MPLPYRSLVVPSPVEEVWAVARRFDGLPTWHPAIDASSLDSGAEGQVGAVRRLTLAGGGGTVVERLVSLDDDAHRLVYTILQSPFPVRRYVSTLRLAPITDTGETFAEWFAEYDSDASDEAGNNALFGDGVFGAGLAALRDHVGR